MNSSMSDLICADCKTPTEVIFDHATGDTVCSECGLVLESHFIDETSEWRTFSDSIDDPSRVGAATDPLMNCLPLTTVITSVKGAAPTDINTGMGAAVDNKSKPDRLFSAFNAIALMADRLSLVPAIEDRAKELFKKVIFDTKVASWKGKKHSDAMCAACLFVACQQENLPRTLKEVCSAVEGGATKKDVGKAKQFIMKHLDITNNDNNNINECDDSRSANNRVARAADFVRRFCSKSGVMDNRAMRAAIDTAMTAEEELDVRRSPLSVAAGVIFVISRLSEETKRPTLRDIVVATGVAEGTIKNVYKDLRPHVGKIIPRWFASEADVKNLAL